MQPKRNKANGLIAQLSDQTKSKSTTYITNI